MSILDAILEAQERTVRLSAESSDPIRDLAQYYAGLLNTFLHGMVKEPSDLLDLAEQDLEGTPYKLKRDQNGFWQVVRATMMFSVMRRIIWLGAQRSPKGGITIQGKFYRGGQFIPGKVIAKASPEEKAKLEARKQQDDINAAERKQERLKRGVDVAKLKSTLDQHKGELSAKQLGNAKRAFHALRRHHGDAVFHRIEEIANILTEQLAANEGRDWLTNQLRGKLAGLSEMVEMADEWKKPVQKARSLFSIIKEKGGLDPEQLKRNYGPESIKQEGLLGVTLKGGIGIDDMAATLVAEGHIVPPEGVNETDYLWEQLKAKAITLHDAGDYYEQQFEREYAEYVRQAQEAQISESDIAEAVRSGEEEGEIEGGQSEWFETVGELAEESGDASFDFGANVEEKSEENDYSNMSPEEYQKTLSQKFFDLVESGESAFKPGSIKIGSDGILRAYYGKKQGWTKPDLFEPVWMQASHELGMPNPFDQKLDYGIGKQTFLDDKTYDQFVQKYYNGEHWRVIDEADNAGLPVQDYVKSKLDQLPGGKADNIPDAAFPQDKLAQGTEHELEHTNDAGTAKEIAKDHLAENGPEYYDDLEKVEGPQDGDVNADGLIFHNGRWHRKDELDGSTEPGTQANTEGTEQIRPDSGVSSGSVRKTPRIITERESLTKKPDLSRVPENLREHLTPAQQEGVALSIEAMDRVGGFLLADGTGVGKSRQILANASHYASQGKKVVIVAPNAVITPDWKKNKVGGSYGNDAAAMGLEMVLTKGQDPLEDGKISVTTYENLKSLKNQIDPDTVVLFDESHSIKNANSQRGRHGRDISFKAGKVMYATATPADKPLHIAHLIRAGVFGGGDENSKKFWGKSEDTYQKLGMRKKEVYNRYTGQTVSTWQVDPSVGALEVMRRIGGLFDQMTKEGLMVRRSMSMDGVDADFKNIELGEDAAKIVNDAYSKALGEDSYEEIRKLEDQMYGYKQQFKYANQEIRRAREGDAGYSINDLPKLKDDARKAKELADQTYAKLQSLYEKSKSSGNKALALMEMRRAQEPFKIPATVDMVREEIAAGRKPIIFLGRVHELDNDDDDDSGNIDTNTAKQLKEALISAGIDASKIGELHGAATPDSASKVRAMKAFNNNKSDILISTLQSGGTGVNLDDTTGDSPRTIIMMTPPLSANDMVQAAGRVNRMSTKSNSKIRTVLSDHPVDQWNAELLQKKIQTLGATIGGSQAQQLIGAEVDEDTPFDWGQKLVRPKEQKPEPKTTKYKHDVVNTKYGTRYVHTFRADQRFWNARKRNQIPNEMSPSKLPNGEWVVKVWAKKPEDVDRIMDEWNK